MLRRIVECVPNFSEGRNPEVLREIAGVIRAVPGVLLLGEEHDVDHHRAVITFVGPPEAVLEAAVRAAEVARARIDLRQHKGVHPRIGALDVLPFIPVENFTLADCVALARQAAQQIWLRCGVPSYLYEAAALREDRRNLADIRRGDFEGLSTAVAMHPSRQPDIGGPLLHPTAGAIAVGARKFLIAWNVLLKTADLSIARSIASLVRQSSGGFPFVKALGLPLPSRGITQVSMNLLDFEETPMQPVFDAIQTEAAKRGVAVVGSELIGFLPRKALEVNVRYSLHFLNLQPDSVLEHRIQTLEKARFFTDAPPSAVANPERSATQALELLGQAANWAEQAFRWEGEKTHHEAPQTSLEDLIALRHYAEAASAEAAFAAESEPHPDDPAIQNQNIQQLLAQADRCVQLKTRLATERQRFQPDRCSQRAIYSFQLAWHLAEASFRCFLLAFPEKLPDPGANLPQQEGPSLWTPGVRERIRAMQSLAL